MAPLARSCTDVLYPAVVAVVQNATMSRLGPAQYALPGRDRPTGVGSGCGQDQERAGIATSPVLVYWI